MRTIIRLQDHGWRNHRYWWIVVMGSYTNPKGRYLEKVGKWVQREGKTVQRAVILNKPRIKYWLAHGADVSKAVQRLLSYADIMPRPYTPYGMKNHYEKKEKGGQLKKPSYDPLNKLGPLQSQYARIKEEEAENMVMRSLKAANEVQKQTKIIRSHDEKLLSDETPENIKERSLEFYELQKRLNEIDSDAKRLHTTKREIIFRRLNRLADQGIVSKSALKNDKSILSEEEFVNQKFNSPEFQEKIKQRQKKFDDWMDLLKPINPQEFKELLTKNTDLTRDKINKETDDIFAFAGDTGLSLSRLDAIEFASKGTRLEEQNMYNAPRTIDDLADAMRANAKDVLIPSKVNVNPRPDLSVLDPLEDYDLGLSYSELANPNKYYESYPKVVPQPERMPKIKIKMKMNKGRKTAVKAKFGTLNSFGPVRATSSLIPYIPMFTGLLRKIGHF